MSYEMKKEAKKDAKIYSKVYKKFQRRYVISYFPRDIYGIDLMDFTSQGYAHLRGRSNCGYVLNVVDIFSKMLFSIRVKTKSEKMFNDTLTELFKRIGKPIKIWSDMEKGLISACKKMKIEVYHTNNSYEGVGSHSVPNVETVNNRMRIALRELKANHPADSWNTLITNMVNTFPSYWNNHGRKALFGFSSYQIFKAPTNSAIIDLIRLNYLKKSYDLSATAHYKAGDYVYLQTPITMRSKAKPKYYETKFKIVEVDNSARPPMYQLEGIKNTKFYEKQLIKAS